MSVTPEKTQALISFLFSFGLDTLLTITLQDSIKHNRFHICFW